jgi:hypothetical protein
LADLAIAEYDEADLSPQVCMYMLIYMCVWVFVYAGTNIYLCILMYIYVYICIYIYMYVFRFQIFGHVCTSSSFVFRSTWLSVHKLYSTWHLVYGVLSEGSTWFHLRKVDLWISSTALLNLKKIRLLLADWRCWSFY